jgi:hypothetical protein
MQDGKGIHCKYVPGTFRPLPPNRACMMAAQIARNSGGEPPLLW